jgi:hypothetical protein
VSGASDAARRSPIDQPVLIHPATGPLMRAYEAWRDSVMQNHIEQRFMDPDTTVVLNKAELAKAIHEEADA